MLTVGCASCSLPVDHWHGHQSTCSWACSSNSYNRQGTNRINDALYLLWENQDAIRHQLRAVRHCMHVRKQFSLFASPPPRALTAIGASILTRILTESPGAAESAEPDREQGPWCEHYQNGRADHSHKTTDNWLNGRYVRTHHSALEL